MSLDTIKSRTRNFLHQDGITPTVRRLAWASLISQIGIVVTGGAVRLTGSGLGCSQWPKCTPESMVPTPEMGIHGLIEFGNRTLTFVLVIIAVLTFFAVLNLRKEHPAIFGLSIGLLAGIPAQALIGGITVWTSLNPWVVGLHFVVSMLLVMQATLLVNLTSPVNFGFVAGGTRSTTQLSWVIFALSWIAVLLGIMTTGAGPHAGDPESPRNQLNLEVIARFHALPVYLLIAAIGLLGLLVFRSSGPQYLRKPLALVSAVVVLQAIIGFTQFALELPVLLVGLHMLGASLTIAASTNLVAVAVRHSRVPKG